MQAIPGYPLPRQATWTEAYYQKVLAANGLLVNPATQFWHFIVGIFHGHFGTVYNSNIKSVTEYFLPPMRYSVMIALPAFVIATVLGISLGIVAAYYRGKWIDTLINIIAVAFIAIPSFILALAFVKLAGVFGLPTQFVAHGTSLKIFESAIMPVLAVALSSISIVLYYTRNELVDVFKQDYIKTALSKGITFRKIVFTHALRNAAIPILSVVVPSLIGVLGGSVIVARFFNVPGISFILVKSVQDKQIYVVLFASLFYSGIAFAMQIIIDVTYTFIDPRIVLAQKNTRSLSSQLKAYRQRLTDKQSLISNVVYFENMHVQPLQISTEPMYVSDSKAPVMLLKKEEPTKQEEEENEKIALPTKLEIKQAEEKIPVYTQVGTPIDLTEKKKALIKPSSFKFTDSMMYNNEQIVGKPSTYWRDVFKRFLKSKSAIIFSIILISMILMAIIIPLMTPNAINKPIANYVGIIDYLPPHDPALGISGIVSEKVVNAETYHQLAIFKDEGYKIYSRAVQQGSSWVLYDFNPYVLPGLQHVSLPMGTDGLGRNWWDLLWYSTAKSLTLAVIASLGSVVIGTIYGAISGAFAGKWPDNIMMRLVEIVGGVPLIIWVLIISMALSGGGTSLFTIALALILTTWMWPATIARTYVLKYKDAEFVYAAQTLGASKLRIIFSHLVPNVVGRLVVVFVNNIPSIIFFEASLVFLGLASSTEVSLGTMINIAWQEGWGYMLVGPTLSIVIITLASQILANNLNDAIDPKIVS